MPASSNSLTVRYTVEIEILSSTATQRRYNSSTSGWSTASASTRAMTRRCSVMRMPVAAQRASIPVALSAGVDFSAVMGSALGNGAWVRQSPPWGPPGLYGCQRLGQDLMRHLFVRSFDPTQTGPHLFSSRSVPPCATAGASRQVAAHHQGVQLFPIRLPVVAFAASDDGKSGPFVQPARRLIIFFDLEEYAAHAAAGEVAEMGHEQ